MQKYTLHKNFIEKSVLSILSNWIDKNKHTFQDAGMGGNRVTSRFYDKIKYPKEVYEVQDKIQKKLNITNLHFMAASCAYPGDHCYLHKDPIYKQGYDTFHCNLFLSNVEGGQPYVLKTPTEDDIIEFNKGDLLCYYVSKVYHGSKTLNKGERKMWVFSFLIQNE